MNQILSTVTWVLCATVAVLAGAAEKMADSPEQPASSRAIALKPLKYNLCGLVVDLGVGLLAWPLPIDFDGDGDLDLAVNCPDKPYNGVYFFENRSGDTAQNPMPVFKPARRVSRGLQNVQVSFVDGRPRVLSPGCLSVQLVFKFGAKPKCWACRHAILSR